MIKELLKKSKQIQVDNKNLEDFRTFFRTEFADPKSDFNKFNLKLDDDEDTISCIISLPSNFDNMSDAFKYKKLQELVKPINDYVIIKSSFVEYLSLPEFYLIEDVEDEEPTGNYLAVWKFTPIENIDNETKLTKIGLNLVTPFVTNDKKLIRKFWFATAGSTIGIGGIITALLLLL